MRRFGSHFGIGAAAVGGTTLLAMGAAAGPIPPRSHAAPPAASAASPAAKPAPTLAQATAGLRRLEGLLPVFVDDAGVRVLIQLPPPDADGVAGRFLYQVYLRSGLGSNPVGLDRSKPGPTQVLVFRRRGDRVLAEYENDAFTATGGQAAERQAVSQSFAVSTVWAGDVAARAPDGGCVIDLTGFLTRDAFGIADALKDAKQGHFALARDLSYADTKALLAFPRNLEFEASETFTGDEPGKEVAAIAPDPHAVSFTLHHSLIALPPPGYAPRAFDPRVGVFNGLVEDYGAPLGAPIARRLVNRFRLEKTDPSAARSPVKTPIVFYLDPAAPEPVRSALLDGARWWAQAFDAAGFIDAFKVEVLPPGVNPLDARYNVINWVHRQTRGWSYGQGIVDPRTGEIVKGSVLLGSQRVRQDRLIFEGLAGADRTGTGGQDDPIRLSLARLRQLAAHETGHALGLAHNFAGSTFDRGSVMDYPPPRIGVADGKLDFRDAYAVGVGRWDRFVIGWLYGEAPPGADEKAWLNGLVADGYAGGLRFVDDDNARPAASAQPWGSLWDDGPDPVAALDHALEVRRIALAKFGLANLPAGAPVADLRRVIPPIYLFHRYETDAAAKLVGGVYFPNAVNGDGREAARDVGGAEQRRALAAVLRTVAPAGLDLPDSLIALLSSAQSGAADPQFDVEVFGRPGDPVFDLPTAADAAADLAFSDLLQPERLNRVAAMGGRDPDGLGLGELLGTTIETVFGAKGEPGRTAELRRRVRARLVADLAASLYDPRLSPSAAAQVRSALTGLGRTLARTRTSDAADRAQAMALSAMLLETDREPLKALAEAQKARGDTVPPGAPIGAASQSGEDGWFDEAVGRRAGDAP